MPRTRKPHECARCAATLTRAHRAERDRDRLETEKSWLLLALNLTGKDSDLVRENGQPVFPIQQQSGTRLAIINLLTSLRIRS
jgi:hypothetical protein